MNRIFVIFFVTLIITSCQEVKEYNLPNDTNWEARKIEIEHFDDLVQGQTYLPVYSHIYHRFDNRTFNLTVTVSIRNLSISDSIYILNADYFNTEGVRIRQYLQNPMFLKPLETVEIIIEEEDEEGGSGANFIFNWASKNEKNPPLFEAVMISTYGQQGISFSTRGVQIFE